MESWNGLPPYVSLFTVICTKTQKNNKFKPVNVIMKIVVRKLHVVNPGY